MGFQKVYLQNCIFIGDGWCFLLFLVSLRVGSDAVPSSSFRVLRTRWAEPVNIPRSASVRRRRSGNMGGKVGSMGSCDATVMS